jgi:hypothetical protein
MTTDTDFVTDYLRHAGTIKRYACWPTIQTQTVGEHCWQVAMIYEQIFGALSPPVEKFIRLHDVAELVMGDIPFPTKRNHPALKEAYNRAEENVLIGLGVEMPELDPIERIRVKVCDLLEMTAFGMIDRELGSMLAVPIIYRTMAAANELAKGLPRPDYSAVLMFTVKLSERHERVLNQNG